MSGTGTIRRGIRNERNMARGWGQQIALVLLGMMLIPAVALGQAALLPNAKQQYLDDSGNPVSNGTVTYYIPSTSTKKNVWLDAAEGTLSTNPVILDAAGRPMPTGQTFGAGSYRQKVVDQNNITVWDAVTTSTGSSGGGSVAFSEGVMVGTIIAWANTTLPSKYLYTAGQAVSRTVYSDLLTAITYQTTILCQNGIATISVSTTISDSIPIGAPIEASCFTPGTVVNSKTSGQLTMSNNATATTSISAVLFPWGNGNGSTTFNVPDLRGRTLVGRNNMGGTASSVMTSTYYKTPGGAAVDPNANNALAGSQSYTMLSANLPPYTPAGTISANTIAVFQPIQSGTGITAYVPSGSGSGQVNTGILTTATFAGTAAAGQVSTPFSQVQPSMTSDYIIKALPDDSPTGPGVTSIQGMTGAISCSGVVVCNAQTISVTIPTTTLTVGSTTINGGSPSSSYKSFLTNDNGILGNGHIVDIGCGTACPVSFTNNFNVYPNGTLVNGAQLGSGTGAGAGEGGSLTFFTKNPTGSGAPNINQELGFVQICAWNSAAWCNSAQPAIVWITTEAWNVTNNGAGNLFQATTRGQASARGEACIAEGLTVALMSGSCTVGLGIGTINSGAGTYDTSVRVLSSVNPTMTNNQNNATTLTVANSSTGISASSSFSVANSANVAQYGIGGTGNTVLSSLLQNKAFIYSSTGAAGIILYADAAAHPITAVTNGTEVWRTLLGFSVGTTTDPGPGGIIANGATIRFTALASDTAQIDNTVCINSTGVLLKGTGALGICLGTSGAQFKTAFAPMAAGITELMRIDFQTYRYREGFGDSGARVQYGTTAQNVETVLPDLVGHNTSGEAINYDSGALLFIGLRAVQQLKAENDNLRDEIEKISKRVFRKIGVTKK